MSAPAIAASGLHRTFGRVVALDGVDLAVPAGSIFAFLGPNGAGKTTFIRCLLGLLRPDRGRIEVLGAPSPLAPRLLGRIGALVETPSLYRHLSGRENVERCRLLHGLAKEATARVLETVELGPAADRGVAGYSQGMRQRLGLALAMLPEPSLLVLDEPMNGLDPAGIRDLRALLAGIAAGGATTIFLSSHLLAEVEQLASHCAVLRGGRVVYQGDLGGLLLSARSGGRVLFGVDRPQEVARRLAAEGLEVRVEPSGRVSAICPDEREAARLNRLLVEAGFAVHHLERVRPRLESAFLDVVEGGSDDSESQR